MARSSVAVALQAEGRLQASCGEKKELLWNLLCRKLLSCMRGALHSNRLLGVLSGSGKTSELDETRKPESMRLRRENEGVTGPEINNGGHLGRDFPVQIDGGVN